MKNKLLIFLFCAGITIAEAQIITDVAGNSSQGYSGDGGNAIEAQLNRPQDIVFDQVGNLYFSDQNNHCVRKINPSGIISNYAGNGTAGFSGDGNLALNAQLNKPQGLAMDQFGNLYIADKGNYRIRKVSANGVITTIAGTGSNFWNFDNGQAIQTNIIPSDLTIDNLGNIYVADSNRVRKITTNGIISIIAGNYLSSGNGQIWGQSALLGSLNNVQGIELGSNGNIYISDTDYNRILRIDSLGNIYVKVSNAGFLGGGNACINCLAFNAYMNFPKGIVLDSIGNLFTYERTWGGPQGGWIRKVNLQDTISIFVETNPTTTYQAGYLAFDHNGSLYFSEPGNNVIRKITQCPSPIPAICMVQVDSLSENNIIYWDKTLYNNADTFYIYRDTSNYNFAIIGKVPADSLSLFVDTVRNLYAANGDPNITSWRYKIAYYDTCNHSMSPLSPWHQTIYQYNVGGLFIWNHYQIEGQPVPVPGLANYLLKRDNIGGSGNWTLAASAAAASTNINDPNFSVYENVADWKIETQWTIECSPIRTTISTTRSNIKKSSLGSSIFQKNNNPSIKIFPNPSSNSITVDANLYKGNEHLFLTIFDVFGAVALKSIIIADINTIDISQLADGMFTIEIKNGLISEHIKLIKNSD